MGRKIYMISNKCGDFLVGSIYVFLTDIVVHCVTGLPGLSNVTIIDVFELVIMNAAVNIFGVYRHYLDISSLNGNSL